MYLSFYKMTADEGKPPYIHGQALHALDPNMIFLEDTYDDFMECWIQALSGQSTQIATISYIHAQSPTIAAAVDSIETLLTGEKNAVGTQVEFEKI